MHLFSPLKIRDITLRHRILVSPMCQYSSDDGFANDWHLVHLGSRAVGGAAIVFTEATAVTAEGRISPQDLGLWKDEHVEMLSRITRFIRSQGSIPGIQLAHSGRKGSTRRPWEQPGGAIPQAEGGWTPVAPSALAFDPTYAVPAALGERGIRAVVQAFADGAGRALEAGFQVIEIHAAHGYLIHEFHSPLANKRTDAYGGSLENRGRLLREVVTAVRNVWPERLPLFVRISSTDWVDGGWDLEQSIELVKQIKPLGVDLIDASSGGTVPGAKIPFGAGYQVPFAAAIRERTGILTGAVGLITSREQAEKIVSEGKADAVLLAREFLRHPYWPLGAAREAGQSIAWPAQYLRAAPDGSPLRQPSDVSREVERAAEKVR
jgi:2,4-dienoyl-CoA reductase-like NADH-dependent reductase (Old Yellow Enzyme family)